MLSGEAKIPIIQSLARPDRSWTQIYHIQGEHIKHYTTDAVCIFVHHEHGKGKCM